MMNEWQLEFTVNPNQIAPAHRIAIITEAFYPKVDGVTKLATLTVRYNLQIGREVVIFAPYLENDLGQTPKFVDGARVVAVPSIRLNFFPKDTRLGIPYFGLQELTDFGPDLIHLFSPTLLSWTGITYASQYKVPIIANYQTDLPGYTDRFGFGILKQPTWNYLRLMHNQTDLNLVPTEYNIRELDEKGFNNLRLWRRGADLHRFGPSKRTQAMRERLLAGRSADNVVALYVGRLSPEKRVDLLTETVDIEGVAVTIVGDGTMRQSLEQQFGDKAHFMGFLTGEDLAQAYASADIFVFTGTNEVAGQVVLEALVSGLPVIIPNTGGITDYVQVGINGFLCEPTSGAYREKITYLRDNPTVRLEMARNAYEIASQYSWQDCMRDLESLYVEACQMWR